MAYLAIFVLTFLDFAHLFETAAVSRPNETVENDGKLYITGNHNHIVISNYGKNGGAPAEIHEKLNSLVRKDLELSNKIQELDSRILKLKQMEKRFSSMNKTILELNNKIHDVTLNKQDDYALLFTTKGSTDYVITRGMPTLSAVTACCWLKSTDTSSFGTPISYAVKGQANEFIVYNYNSLDVYVNGEGRSTSVSVTDGVWHHVCATWENTAGSWKLYKDGTVASSGQGFKTGRVIRPGGALVLGNEQNGAVGGGLDAQFSFIGELTGVNIWDHVIDSHKIALLSKSCVAGEGNVFKWSDFKPHIRGGVQYIHPSCKA